MTRHLALFIALLAVSPAIAAWPAPAQAALDDTAGDGRLAPQGLLARWSQLAQGDAPAAALAGLAGAGLRFAELAAAPDAEPGELVAALGPLRAAQARAVEAMVPGFAAGPAGGNLDAAAAALGLLASREPPLAQALTASRLLAAAAGLEPSLAGPPELPGTAQSPLLGALALASGPSPLQPLPPVPRFGDVGQALEALLRSHGLEPGPEDLAAIEELRSLPPKVEAALTRVVEAHLFQAEAARLALGGADAYEPGEARVADLGLLVAARGVAAAMVLEAAPGLACAGATRAVFQVAVIDLSCSDGSYDNDTALLVDVGGHDRYANNAGGAAFMPLFVQAGTLTAAMLVDVGGDDVRNGAKSRSRGLNGAAGLGSGLLFDFGEGNDTYAGAAPQDGAVNGGAFAGAGLLFDDGGRDLYAGSVPRLGGVNGGAYQGSGLLVDLGGPDIYDAAVGSGGANGGASNGAGLLLDVAGDDTYVGAATRGGVNGGAEIAGVGRLLDLSGNDRYAANITEAGGANGASFRGAGLLLDHEGDDSYDASVAGDGAANGAAFGGAGLLLDRAGSDRYAGVVGQGGLNGGAFLGLGLLLDGGGDDAYAGSVVGDGGMNGGAVAGLGLLADQGAGVNAFSGAVGGRGGVNGAAEGVTLLSLPLGPVLPRGVSLPGGIGVLLAGPGDDRYAGAGTTQGAAGAYGLGLLLDAGGHNTYVAGPGGLAQGAGRVTGVGVLVDRGASSHFNLLDRALGQGAGLQGVGLLVRTERAAENLYEAAPTAGRSLARGAGAGLVLDAGALRLLGPPPNFTCVREPLDLGPLGVPGFNVCGPDRGSAEPILDPLTGEPLGAVPKPGVDCTRIAFGPVGVPAPPVPVPVPQPSPPSPVPPLPPVPSSVGPVVLPIGACPGALALLGPEAQPWVASTQVEATTSGGLSVLYGQEVGQPAQGQPLKGKLVAAEMDHVCDLGCRRLGVQ